jgi:hypothetical protein
MHPYLLFLKLGMWESRKKVQMACQKRREKRGKGQKQGVLPRHLIYQTRSMVETKYVARKTTAITMPITNVFMRNLPVRKAVAVQRTRAAKSKNI